MRCKGSKGRFRYFEYLTTIVNKDHGIPGRFFAWYGPAFHVCGSRVKAWVRFADAGITFPSDESGAFSSLASFIHFKVV